MSIKINVNNNDKLNKLSQDFLLKNILDYDQNAKIKRYENLHLQSEIDIPDFKKVVLSHFSKRENGNAKLTVSPKMNGQIIHYFSFNDLTILFLK